jgi:hypothetical protein
MELASNTPLVSRKLVTLVFDLALERDEKERVELLQAMAQGERSICQSLVRSVDQSESTDLREVALHSLLVLSDACELVEPLDLAQLSSVLTSHFPDELGAASGQPARLAQPNSLSGTIEPTPTAAHEAEANHYDDPALSARQLAQKMSAFSQARKARQAEQERLRVESEEQMRQREQNQQGRGGGTPHQGRAHEGVFPSSPFDFDPFFLQPSLFGGPSLFRPQPLFFA